VTILNVAVGTDEVAIVTDSRQSIEAAPIPEVASKCTAIPVHRLMVAYCGTGMGRLMPAVFGLLMGRLPAADVTVLAEDDNLPKFLREISARKQFLDDGMIVIAGIVDDAARAYILCAPQWNARPLPIGAWLMPAPVSDAESTPSDKAPTPSVDLTQRPDQPREYYRSLDSIHQATALQLRRNPVSCGGPLILSRIDVGGRISQTLIQAPGTE
jgi:hypothetical protein